MKQHFLKLIAFITLFVCISQAVSCQVTLELQRKKRIGKIFADDDCVFSMLPVTNGNQTINKIYFGKILSQKDSIITLLATECNTQVKEKGKKIPVDFHMYQPKDTTLQLHLKNMAEIETFRDWFIAPVLVGFAGLVSGLIVSPLVSINYKNGSFDENKFYRISGYSLATSAVFLTASYKFGDKKYFIHPFEKHKKRLWKVRT